MALQARTEFAAAINQIASEKGVDTGVILDAIQQAALAAYRKDLSLRNEPIPDDFEELKAEINPSSGEISILRGTENITPPGFARIAAQTAKQVITQRLHEAEKGAIMEEYDKKVGTVLSGIIQRQEGNTYFVDLGRAEGVMPPQEQTKDEYYHLNQRLKFFVKEIREGYRGLEVVVSRSDAGLVKGLFGMEVPEIQAGSVSIQEIAREAGGRTKVAAISTQDGVDPVGSLVGQKGVRVQAVINELGEEKIDIIAYSDDPERYIAAALSPAKDVQVSLNPQERTAKVKIPEAQLSLAIGKGGQNVRLAAKLTGWKIDIEGLEGTEKKEAGTKETEQQVATTDTTAVADDTQVIDQTVEEAEIGKTEGAKGQGSEGQGSGGQEDEETEGQRDKGTEESDNSEKSDKSEKQEELGVKENQDEQSDSVKP